MADDTTFPLIPKADIDAAREHIERETGLSKRTWELVDTIWPRTPGQEPATLYTIEPIAQMDEFAGAQAELHAEMDETEFLLRGNNRARLEASIAAFDAGEGFLADLVETGDDDLPTPIASYDAYVLSHRFKDVMAECEEGGNLHILVSDANVEDDDVAYLTDKAETPAEKACIELAAQLSPGERWAAWLIANGRETEARGRGFAAQDTPPEVISELRAFIDSLDDDTLTQAEQKAYRAEVREANRLATETSQQHGVALHPRVAALRAGDDDN